MKEAEALKTALQAGQSNYSEIMKLIKTDATWSWSHEKQKEKLKAASEGIRNQLTPWHKEWLYASEPFSIAKTKYAAARWRAEFTAFTKMEPAINRLKAMCEMSREAHKKVQEAMVMGDSS